MNKKSFLLGITKGVQMPNSPKISDRVRTSLLLTVIPHHCHQRREIKGTRDREIIKEEQMWTVSHLTEKKIIV